MNWLLVAAVGQIIIGTSAVFDKLLLTQQSINAVAYTFWLGILGAFAALFVPFGFEGADLSTIARALASGALFVAGFFFLYRTLEKSEATETFPLVGALSPVITLVLSSFVLTQRIGFFEKAGFALLVMAGLLLFFSETKKLRWTTFTGALLASGFFATSYVVAKIVFLETNFITGFVWMKAGGVLCALSFLVFPALRRRIFEENPSRERGNALAYILNRGYAGVGSILISYAVFLSDPALVDATQNLKYAVIFVFAWLLAGERFEGRAFLKKLFATAIVILGLLSLSAGDYVSRLPVVDASRAIVWGVTFSPKFAEELRLDWRKTYSAILEELEPRRIRLIAYWDRIEKNRGQFDFSELDWQFERAEMSGASVILAVGMKVPRWPECHIPAWASDLGIDAREEALHSYLRALVARYGSRQSVSMIQVENEPYLMFGVCPERGSGFLENEISVVKTGTERPILTTDAGELGLWYRAMSAGDVFGTTMYRVVYPRFIGPLIGTIEYPLSPDHFRAKEKLVRSGLGDFSKRILVIELQGEPWGSKHLNELPYEEQLELFSPDYFASTLEYAKRSGFEEYYLWGAEWWYFAKETHGDARYWDIAKNILSETGR